MVTPDPFADLPLVASPDAASAISDPTTVFRVPVAQVVMHGTGRFDAAHPFVAALREGAPALERFYAAHQPADLAAMYHLPHTGLAGETLPPWVLPWLAATPPPVGEGGLGLEHGVSYFGPCTPVKVALEMERLNGTRASIATHGYQPTQEIEGLFLERDGGLRFFVRGGKHRAAVLVTLGYPTLRVKLRARWPALVRAASIPDWPLVAAGQVAPDLAAGILERYFA